MEDRLILDLCGGTGSWSAPYAEAGYEVLIVDPRKDTGDVRLLEVPPRRVHGILAAPPCTHLSGSGARWWASKGDAALLEALAVVDACLRIVAATQPEWWALENPVGRLRRYLGAPRLIFQPCDYGDPYTKRTCVWGSFAMPQKTPVEPTMGSIIWKMPDSKGRWERRSVTPPGFARAFFDANR